MGIWAIRMKMSGSDALISCKLNLSYGWNLLTPWSSASRTLELTSKLDHRPIGLRYSLRQEVLEVRNVLQDCRIDANKGLALKVMNSSGTQGHGE